jgi:hypothetical protein
MTFSSTTSLAQSAFGSEWDAESEMVEEDELAIDVFEQWQYSDMDSGVYGTSRPNNVAVMDEEHGNSADISPTGLSEELYPMMDLNLLGYDGFLMPNHYVDNGSVLEDAINSLPFENRFEPTSQKLAEFMRRSQESRKSLKMEIRETSKYARNESLSGVLDLVEKSTHELQACLETVDTPQFAEV